MTEPSKWQMWLRIALAGILFSSAIAKAASGYPVHTGIPEELYWLAAVFELVIAMMLFGRVARAALVLAMLLAGAGVAHAWLSSGTPCGCLGSVVELGRRGELVLAGAVGLLATIALACMRETRGGRTWSLFHQSS